MVRFTRVVLVSGLPCSGKTTHVAQHKQPGDVVVDYDALGVALGSPDTHDHPESIRPYIVATRRAAIALAASHKRRTTVWVIDCDPDPDLIAFSDEHVALDTPASVCKARAVAAGRPPSWLALIDRMKPSSREW